MRLQRFPNLVRVFALLVVLAIFLRATPNLLHTCFEISGKCSLSVEPPEQIALFTVLWADDVVLELGGNIGTSCIAAARMGSTVMCTEPNPELWDALADNRQATGTTFEILRGVVQPHCDNESVPIFVVCLSVFLRMELALFVKFCYPFLTALPATLCRKIERHQKYGKAKDLAGVRM